MRRGTKGGEGSDVPTTPASHASRPEYSRRSQICLFKWAVWCTFGSDCGLRYTLGSVAHKVVRSPVLPGTIARTAYCLVFLYVRCCRPDVASRRPPFSTLTHGGRPSTTRVGTGFSIIAWNARPASLDAVADIDRRYLRHRYTQCFT